MVATGEITGFDLAKKKVEICTKKGQKNKMMMMSIIFIKQFDLRTTTGELKFRKEKRVKKPLKIACDGQFC